MVLLSNQYKYRWLHRQGVGTQDSYDLLGLGKDTDNDLHSQQ